MPTWPSSLPAPLLTGYEINPEDPILRTQMDAGPDRVRRKFTAIPSRIPVRWRFTQAQFALFEAWHKLEALDGAAWFSIALANGLGFQTMEAKFVKPPKKAPLSGMNWEVSAELEVRALPVMTQEYLDAALAYEPNEIVYADPLFNTLVNTTLPAAGF
jgi:hypothetical protein